MSNQFGICLKKVAKNKEIVLPGTLFSIINSEVTCVTGKRIEKNKFNEYVQIPVDYQQIITKELCDFLLPVKPDGVRVKILQQQEFLLKIQVGDKVRVSGSSIKIPGIFNCLVCYIGVVPQLTLNGKYFGLELLSVSRFNF